MELKAHLEDTTEEEVELEAEEEVELRATANWRRS